MATLNPDHLFEQADKLVVLPRADPPRQVDLRQVISVAYYGIFHFCLTAAADEFVGVTQRATSRYALVYRSIDHRTLRDLCLEAKKPTPQAKFAPYFPAGGFGPNIQTFCTFAVELQLKRHLADYNPQPRSSTGAGPGGRSKPSSSPHWNGWTGSTIEGCWSRSVTSRRPKPRNGTMLRQGHPPWRRDSNETASGEAGAVHQRERWRARRDSNSQPPDP